MFILARCPMDFYYNCITFKTIFTCFYVTEEIVLELNVTFD